MDIKGGAAIVTGSASGVGAATAKLLAEKGCNVVINYTKSEKEARETQAECEAKGVETILCQADVSSDDDCQRLARECMDKWGRIDALVCCAGRTKFANPFDLNSISGQDFLDIYAVNTVGTFQSIRACVPHMKAGGQGAIAIVSALASLDGTGSSMAYACSKAALNTMTITLARTLGPEIRVNAICPGFIEGRWMRAGLGDRYEEYKKITEASNPLHRVSQPEDIAATLVFLVEGTDVLTGEILQGYLGQRLGVRAGSSAQKPS